MTAQQLKNSILQMAVQGKLVPQDPGDEPASVLLQRIKAEKQELIKAGKIKKDKKSSEIFRGASCNLPYAFCEQIGKEIRDISDEIPFEIPDSWEWVHLDNIAISDLGKTLDKAKNTGNFQPYLCSINVYWNGIDLSKVKEARFEDSELPKYLLKKGDLLICEGGEVGRCCVWDKDIPMYYQNALHRVRFYGNINPHYFKCLMELYKGIGIIEAHSKGVTIKHLVQKALNRIYFPLPPLSEQHRIVSKIEELLPYIEKYGKAEEHLTTLNTTFSEALKKSILQEAVQGKLVPQNSDDEPASVLLERIRAEKQKLIKAGKIKKSKHESVIITRDKIPYEIVDGKERCIADDVPFEIPDTWCWCRLGTISCYFDAGKSPNCIKQSVTGDEYGVITTTSIQLGYFNESQNKVLPPNFEVKEDMKVKKGDILITRAGPMNRTGVACVVKEIHYNLILSDKTIRINMPDEFFDKDYIVTVLNSPNIREQIIRLMSGMDKQQVNISQDKYKTVFIPLPPLEEQHRIVAKIEELMQYCDRLK